MKEQKIQDLLNTLFSKKFTKKYNHSSDTYNIFAIDEQARTMIEDTIRNYLSENRDEKTGVLEAKVFMYEQIISKSNFAPMIEKAVGEKKEEKDNEPPTLFNAQT